MKSVLISMMQLHKNTGSARTAFENIRYFKTAGYEVHVASMSMDKDKIIENGGIPHKVLPWLKATGLWRRRWYNWQVQRLKRKLNPQITLGHGDIQEQDVLTLHNCVFLASELIEGRPLNSKNEMAKTHGSILKAQSFKKMIANSQMMKKDTVERFNVSPDKIKVIYPALDPKTFYPSPGEKAKLRKSFGFSDKVVVAFVTSGNFKKRGFDIFKEAIDALPIEIKGRADFRALGSGEISGETPITFDPPLKDIQNYYNAIDVFVLPARFEEFGRVVLEAMGCGLPVITTDKVGAAELLSGESAKFIIPTNDPHALKDALIELISNPELRGRLGKLNAELALKESEEGLAAKFDELFLEL